MNRKAFAVLLAVAVGVAIVLLLPSRDELPGSGRISRTTSSGERPAERKETTNPSLKGTPGAGAPNTSKRGALATLFGTVLDGATRAGVERARVVAYHAGEDVYRLAWTDAEGRFGLYNLTAGRWWLFAYHPEYVPGGLAEFLAGEVGAEPPDALRLEVPAGVAMLPRRTIEVSQGRRIEGRVVDPAGRGVAGLKILLEDGWWRRALEKRLRFRLGDYEKYVPLHSDEDGRFVVACLPPEMGKVKLGARGHGQVSRWSEAIDLDPGLPPVDLVLEAVHTATVTGHVRRADGTPGVPSEVSLAFGLMSDVQDVWALKWIRDVPVDAEGAYRLEGLPPQALDLDADWVDPYLPGADLELQALAPGEVRSGVDFTLPERHVLSGRLVTAAGEPLAGEHLVVYRTAADGSRITDDELGPFTDEFQAGKDGAFEVATTHAGPLTIEHVRPSGAHETLRAGLVLPVDDLALVSTASPRTRIEIRARDKDGNVVPRFRSSVEPAGGSDFDSDVDGRDGAAVHDVLGRPPFRVVVGQAANADGERLPLGWGRLRLDEMPADGIVQVVLHPENLIFGRIVGPGGRAVPGVRLTLVDISTEPWTETDIPVDADGNYAHVPTVDVSAFSGIRVTVPPGYQAVPSFSPEVGERTPTIVLRPGAAIAGRLILPEDARSQPGAGPLVVLVSWKEPKRGLVRAEADEEGRWRAEGVPIDVDLRVLVIPMSAMQRGFGPPPAVDGLRAGDFGVEIRLVAGLSISGRCRLADDTPPPAKSVLVMASPKDTEDAYTGFGETSGDGSFVIGGLSPGTHTLKAYDLKTRMILDERDVEPGATGIEIRLPERGSIRVEATEPEDWESACRGWSIAAWATGTTRVRAHHSVSTRGAFVIEGLPADEVYDLVVTDDEGLVGTVGGVRVGDAVKVELVLGEPFSGRVRRAGGSEEPLRGELYAIRSGACFNLLMDPDGEFHYIFGIAPGRYEIRYVAKDGTTTVLARGVEAGTEDQDLVLPD